MPLANKTLAKASLVEIVDVRKSFGPTEVLKGVSVDVERGDVVAIIGRSGSGKSTLLRCINGLETIDAGSIGVGGGRKIDATGQWEGGPVRCSYPWGFTFIST